MVCNRTHACTDVSLSLGSLIGGLVQHFAGLFMNDYLCDVFNIDQYLWIVVLINRLQLSHLVFQLV